MDCCIVIYMLESIWKGHTWKVTSVKNDGDGDTDTDSEFSDSHFVVVSGMKNNTPFPDSASFHQLSSNTHATILSMDVILHSV